MSKVKCFNYDNYGHLAKDCPNPPWLNRCITQGKFIIQGGFVAKIGAHESEASNLLKLNCKINYEFVCWFLDSRATNSFMTPQLAEWFRVKIELMANPIIV
jgi:hypothetical protein